MATNWKKLIKDGILGVDIYQKDQVKITCRSKADGEDVYNVINSHYEELGGAPKSVVKGSSYKDFRLKYSSSAKAKEVKEILDEIRNADYTKKPEDDTPAPSAPETSAPETPASSAPETSAPETPASSAPSVETAVETSDNTVLYIGIGAAVLFAVVVGLVIWKKRR